MESEISTCRICQYNSQRANLIQPCECKDPSVLIHRRCLDHVQHKTCESCNFEYEIEWGGFKPFVDWWKFPAELEYVPLGEYYAAFLLVYFVFCIFSHLTTGPIIWYYSWAHKFNLIVGILISILWFKSILLFEWKDKSN